MLYISGSCCIIIEPVRERTGSACAPKFQPRSPLRPDANNVACISRPVVSNVFYCPHEFQSNRMDKREQKRRRSGKEELVWPSSDATRSLSLRIPLSAPLTLSVSPHSL